MISSRVTILTTLGPLMAVSLSQCLCDRGPQTKLLSVALVIPAPHRYAVDDGNRLLHLGAAPDLTRPGALQDRMSRTITLNTDAIVPALRITYGKIDTKGTAVVRWFGCNSE